jgi:hypothetical protein
VLLYIISFSLGLAKRVQRAGRYWSTLDGQRWLLLRVLLEFDFLMLPNLITWIGSVVLKVFTVSST